MLPDRQAWEICHACKSQYWVRIILYLSYDELIILDYSLRGQLIRLDGEFRRNTGHDIDWEDVDGEGISALVKPGLRADPSSARHEPDHVSIMSPGQVLR